MDDYRKKRRYRQQKLSRQGFYELRQQRSRARRQNEAGRQGMPSLSQIIHPDNLIRAYEDLHRSAGHAPDPSTALGMTIEAVLSVHGCQMAQT